MVAWRNKATLPLPWLAVGGVAGRGTGVLGRSLARRVWGD